MKKYLLTFVFLSLAGGETLSEIGRAEESEAAPSAAPACEEPCLKKVCVPECAKKKVTKVEYDQKCVDYCVPRHSLLSLFHHSDCDQCQECGKQVQSKHILVKKIIVTDEDTVKCVPRLVDSSCPAPGEVHGAAPTPELVPAPKPGGLGGLKPELVPPPKPNENPKE
jgi:hypothetical protein